MTKNIVALIAAAALVTLLTLIVLASPQPVAVIGAIIGCAFVGWLVATWYYADDNPVFAPKTNDRVTFLAVLQNLFRDVATLTRPVWSRLWLNIHFVAVMGVDAVALMQEDMRAAIFGNTWLALAVVVLNLVARYGATAAHAPVASK